MQHRFNLLVVLIFLGQLVSCGSRIDVSEHPNGLGAENHRSLAQALYLAGMREVEEIRPSKQDEIVFAIDPAVSERDISDLRVLGGKNISIISPQLHSTTPDNIQGHLLIIFREIVIEKNAVIISDTVQSGGSSELHEIKLILREGNWVILNYRVTAIIN